VLTFSISVIALWVFMACC